MTAAWQAGDTAAAAREFSSKADKSADKDGVIWHLEAGTAQRAAGNYEESNRHFDAADALIDKYEAQARIKVGREAAAIMSNQQNLPYEGRPYDKIMLHTYKALNYLALNRPDQARPELIRAYQCQQDAVAENQRRIAKAQEAESESPNRAAIERAKSNPQFSQSVDNLLRPAEGLRSYADYVNPFTVYLDGLYFLHNAADGSDLERASKSMNRALEMAGDNQFVMADAQAGHRSLMPVTYVIFETGHVASLEQVRIDIPLFFENLYYVGAAFPKLVIHADAAPYLTVKTSTAQENTLPIASMDAIVAQDFKNQMPVIVTKTLISTIAKAAASYAVNKTVNNQDNLAGVFTRLATAVVQIAVNIADTRSWTTLPKDFQVARITTPADRQLTASTPSGATMQLTLIDGFANVVYAKSVTANGPLVIHQFKLK